LAFKALINKKVAASLKQKRLQKPSTLSYFNVWLAQLQL